MKCPVCNTWTTVIDTRGPRRRRECGNLHRFNTLESAVPDGRSSSTNSTAASTKTQPPAKSGPK